MSATCRRLLVLLQRSPQVEFTFNDLRSMTGVWRWRLSHELARLVDAGLLDARVEPGGRVHYSLAKTP